MGKIIKARSKIIQDPSPEELLELLPLLEAGRNQKVLSILDPLIIRFPNSPALHLISGSANYELSRLDLAIEHYRKALELDPKLVPAYSNLGAALNDKGEVEAAIECYENVILLDPQHADAFFNMGSLQIRKQETEAAIESFNTALAIEPTHSEASNGLGLVFKHQGNYSSAIEYFKKAVELNPNYSIAHKNLGDVLQNTVEYELAIKSYKRAIELNPKFAEAYNAAGSAYRELKEIEAAIKSYDLAIKCSPTYTEAHFNLGSILFLKGEFRGSIACYKRVIDFEPDDEVAYRMIANALAKTSIKKNDADLSNIAQKLLNKNNSFWPTEIVYPVINLLKADSSFMGLLSIDWNNSQKDSLQAFLKEVLKVPLFEKIITICQIPDPEIDELLENVREAFFLNLSDLDFDKRELGFFSALSLQCFINEYMYSHSEQAEEGLRKLERSIENHVFDGNQPSTKEILALAAFKPLHCYSWIDALTEIADFKDVYDKQVVEIKVEKAIQSSVPTLQKIVNEVSIAVRSQYEENPYPRWIHTQLELNPVSIEQFIKIRNLRAEKNEVTNCKSPRILIAGCGTGQHAIQVASLFKNSRLLAVDISGSSLAYAKRKTEELGISSIEYRQVDILSLPELKERFDLIECGGVLHHMQCPTAGWEILTNLLKPGGMMKIGLYSKLARRHINKIREEIKNMRVGKDAHSLRSFRKIIMKSELSHYKHLHSVMDLYSLSELRDLLFHVQEHQFTIPDIEECLSSLGLQFCGFENEKVITQFKTDSANSNEIYDLKKWNEFEISNPNLFMNMYQFWCQKNV